jgi:DnaK suppressor protein
MAAKKSTKPTTSSKAKPKAPKKSAPKKQPPKPKTSANKKATVKSGVKKPVTAKASAKTAPAKKKSPTAKTVAKKAAVKKAPVKKAPAKSTVAKKAASSKPKAAAKKTPVKTAPAKKAPAKKALAKKATANKKSAAAKAAPKKSVAQKKATKVNVSSSITTSGIAGSSFQPYQPKRNEEYMSEGQRAHFKGILLEWRRELMEEVDRTVTHLKDEAANYPDPSDRASQEEEFSLELRTRDRERKLIRKIEKTIELIDYDDYGFCETCGVEIGIRRLEARPTATECIDCKTLAELKERQLHG